MSDGTFTLPLSSGPGCRETEHGRLLGIWRAILCKAKAGLAAVVLRYPKTSVAIVPQRWTDTRCRRPSSAGFRAWRSGWAFGSRGRAGSSSARYPSWSTGPSRPGHRYRNGRHRPAAQTLRAQNAEPWLHADGFYHRLLQLGKTLLLLLPFLSPKSFGSSFTTPSAGRSVVVGLLHPCLVDILSVWGQRLRKERTDFVHNIHVVHVVSLPQVKGQLWGKEKENCISHWYFPVTFGE